MKITKKRLRQIIKEYYPVAGSSPSPTWKAFYNAAWEAAAEKIGAGMESDGVLDAMVSEVTEVVNELESEWLDDELVGESKKPVVKEEKRKLLSEGAYIHDVFSSATSALESRDGRQLEDLARQVNDLLLPDRERYAYSQALYAMAEAAYELESYEEGEEY